MLSLLRKKKVMKRLLWALALLIIPAFVLWGAGSLTQKEPALKYIGTIDGKKIPVEDFVKSARNVQIGLFLNFFNQPEAFDALRKNRKLLNRLAWENIMISDAAQKEKVSASDAEVVSFIESHPLFVRDGAFDEQLYNYILKNSLGMEPRTFEESVRSILTNAKYRETIVRNVAVSDEELLKAYKNEYDEAKIYYAVIDKADFENEVKISEEEIADYYQKNREQFREPAKIVLQYVEFEHRVEGTKEKAVADLNDFYQKLKARPGEMEEVALESGMTIKKTTPFARDELVPGMEDIRGVGNVAFRLEPLKDILPIVNENEKGISYIIRVKENIPSRLRSAEAASAYINGAIKDIKATELAFLRAGDIYEKAKTKNLTLKKVAKKYGLPVAQTESITRFSYIEGVGEAYSLVDEAFKLKLGEISKPVGVRKGYALIEPVWPQHANQEKFETEKPEFRNKVLTVKKIKALEEWFNKVAANSSLNVDLDVI